EPAGAMSAGKIAVIGGFHWIGKAGAEEPVAGRIRDRFEGEHVRPHSRGWRSDADFVGDYGRVPRAQRRFGNDRKHEDGCKAEVRPVTVLTKPDPARERPRDQAAIEDGRNDDQADGAFVKHYRPDDQAKK